MISNPSASDCIIPYSIPLWTIFTKWPEPDAPTCAWPPGSVRSSRNGVDLLVGGRIAADHHAVALLQAPDPAGDAGVEERDALLLRLLGSDAASRGSSSCRRRRSRRHPRAAARSVWKAFSVGVARRDHQPHDPRLGELATRARRASSPSAPGSCARRSRPCGRARAAARSCSRPSGRGRPFPGSCDVLQLDPRDRPAALFQCRVVSRSLRLDQAAEAELLAGDRELLADIVHDLQEAADRRAALVQLAGRVQVARPEPEGDDAVGLRAQPLDEAAAGAPPRRGRRTPGSRRSRPAAPARGAPRPRTPARRQNAARRRAAAFVRSFASWTFGWSNGLISRIAPATAVANSQR